MISCVFRTHLQNVGSSISRELMKAASDGYEAYLLLVIQMKGVRYFEPNRETHPEFGETLKAAADAGVHILAYDCAITEDSMKICDPVPVKL